VSASLPSDEPRRRIVDEVFAAQADGTRTRTRLRLMLAVLAAALAHGSLVLWAKATEPSLESWATELALRVHAELSKEQLVEMAKPPPPPPPPAPPPPAPRSAVREKLPEPPRAASHSAPQAPAQAAAVVVAEPAPNAPLDLTGETFVTGTATAYAGGVTSATGTSRTAARAVPAAPPAPQGERAPDLSSKVALQEQDWQCPWPREAEGEPIDEQVVILRVVVRPDGSAERAALMRDPGHGFGEAALACALRTRFAPARDRDGKPVKQQSPPIRVRFTR